MSATTCTWPGRIPGDPVHDRIIAYLTIDIQKSPAWTTELIAKIKAVRSGRLSSWERPGNAYCLYIYPQHVVIEDDYAEEVETIRIPIVTFAAAVNAWHDMIHNRVNDN
ncbi:hypothetical protein SAMN05216302_100379 [Nitrosomonas aestuarii]|uniref:Uncharacterized protein n=1 Tax=Nitrosomonas aestuarii TaxID=52441 RepID=A0A1I3Y814_9PROT|nr:hypothetical protein [Nitrosomonas aestuarii]SFK28107.1 hypothetical protein SAMN05216302_100379 [Nitrosomonas aestuarii]